MATAPSMEFSSQETLQAFLARWLEEHGHSVYRQVPSPAGGKIDILTQDYAIDCSHTLTQTALWSAADDMQAQTPHFPDQRPVIAGLTPDQDWEEAYKLAEQLKHSGIEVWFVDQMPPFVNYYNQLVKQSKQAGERAFKRNTPLGGCLISLGMATILSLSFWLAFNILDRHQLKVATNNQQSRAWDQLHTAVEVWDLDTALGSLEQLAKSRNRCVAKFADRFQTTLEQQGSEGFRDI
ncbi:MAG TPA: hypothetical protein IGR64_00065, partial [Leptolyngbyaceae cyanobacterium M65_K2018_010]|nr:hypothetical protein [Leptolyngbyaceae cyanobacterium M65_K2018_010]